MDLKKIFAISRITTPSAFGCHPSVEGNFWGAVEVMDMSETAARILVTVLTHLILFLAGVAIGMGHSERRR